MRNLFLFFLSIVLFACSQKVDDPTHSLELLTPDASEPVSTNAFIYSKNNTQNITIEFPDGLISADFITPTDSTIKFQLAQIRNEILVDIQFIGYGKLNDTISGEFNAYLDFKHRPDMSGTFKVIKLK